MSHFKQRLNNQSFQENNTHSYLIKKSIPLADKNWFGTGGSAAYFAAPKLVQEMQNAVRFARDQDLAIFLLGSGANMLVSDDGVDGLVIKPQIKEITHRDGDADCALVTAQSGVDLSDLITYCLAHNLLGLEEFSGIPGTVGGAVFINLHYFEFLLSHFLLEATVLDMQTNALQAVDNSWFSFGYNTSTLHEGNHILIDATFKLRKAIEVHERFYAMGRRDEIIRQRSKKYPTQNTCGSFFRNFHDDEVTYEVNGKKAIWVAYYLDKIGIKGELRIGDAQVSYQHANMIVNLGFATTDDIIGVARKMQELVAQAFGIVPQPECRLVGFKEYPLIK